MLYLSVRLHDFLYARRSLQAILVYKYILTFCSVHIYKHASAVATYVTVRTLIWQEYVSDLKFDSGKVYNQGKYQYFRRMIA